MWEPLLHNSTLADAAQIVWLGYQHDCMPANLAKIENNRARQSSICVGSTQHAGIKAFAL